MAKKYKRRDKKVKKRTGGGASVPAGSMALIRRSAEWPLLECLITKEWQEAENIIQIAVVRQSDTTGHVAVGGFLVDLGCLGVKNALANLYRSEVEYQHEYREYLMVSQPMTRCPLDLAAKVVQEAVKYADSLGFKPHPDIRYALMVMGETYPEKVNVEVPLGGEDGMPLFIAGPYDDAKRIMRILDRKVGPGNYHFVVPVDDPSMLVDVSDLDDDDFEEYEDDDE